VFFVFAWLLFLSRFFLDLFEKQIEYFLQHFVIFGVFLVLFISETVEESD